MSMNKFSCKDNEQTNINKLKLEMKRWEKQFELENGRKARKEDIDKDENMKQTYIHYWKVIKKKSDRSRIKDDDHKLIDNEPKLQVKQVWGTDCNKKSTDNSNYSNPINDKNPLKRLSSKMLQMSSNVTLSNVSGPKKSFSLKRNKNKDSSECSSVVINSNLITLFKKPKPTLAEDSLDDVIGTVLKEISLPANTDSSMTRETNYQSTNQTLVKNNISEEKDPFKVEINSIISKLEFDKDEFKMDEELLQQAPFENTLNHKQPEMQMLTLSTSVNTSTSVYPTHTTTDFFSTSATSSTVPTIMEQPNHGLISNTLINQNQSTYNMYDASNVTNMYNYEQTINHASNVNYYEAPVASNYSTSTYADTNMSSGLSSAIVNHYDNHSNFHSNSQMDQTFEFATILPNLFDNMISKQLACDSNANNSETTCTQLSSQNTPSYLNLDTNSTANPSMVHVATSAHDPMLTHVNSETTSDDFKNSNSSNKELQYLSTALTMPSQCTPVKKAKIMSEIVAEFSPMKDLPIKNSLLDQVKLLKVPSPIKRTYHEPETVMSDNEELFCESSADEDNDNMPMETFEGVVSANQTALFDINLEPTNKTKLANKSRRKRKNANNDQNDMFDEEDELRKDVKTITKRRKNLQKDANFRRLEFKKKVYSRGHKKFNTSKYKRDQWKKLHSAHGTGCFKCGDPNHWATDCLRDAIMDDNAFDAEMEELAIEKNIEDLSVLPNEQNKFEFDNLDQQVDDALKHLGFECFKSNQKETIMRILSGRSVLFISATGSGKSFCYQLPAYLYSKRNCITLIVSPLISLMEDQVMCLPDGIKGVYLHSGLTEAMKKKQINLIQNGEAHLLYLSPEYILGNLLELSLLPQIAFVCIDEAHCLSEWSNNFRPSYLQLFKTLKHRLNVHTFLALTATANKQTARQIVRNLGIDVKDIVGQTQIPDNLVPTVSRDANKDFALIDLLKSERFNSCKSIIVYCSRREITERLATLIRMEMQQACVLQGQSWSACAYHAGLSYHTRKEIQTRFIRGELRVIVATIAFGMGINKSDVNAIIHYNLPKTFENYVQEIGRAGRNGERAECHLFLDQNGQDLFEQQKHIYANGVDRSNIRKFVNKLFKACKCKQLHSIESEDETNDHVKDGDHMNAKEDALQHQNNVRKCPGHERAFSIRETTQELDLKEETILTLLLFLELNCDKFKLKVLNHTNSKCRLFCYRSGSEQMEQLAKKHSFIALPLANYKRTLMRTQAPEMLEFSHVDVAAMLGQESIFVRRQLKALEWEHNLATGQKSRTNVRVEFSELSFHVVSPGDLSDDEVDDVVQLLLNYSRSQENKEIESLKKMYDTFREFSQQRCTNKINVNKSRELKRFLNSYFDLNDIHLSDEDILLDQLPSQASQSQELIKADDADLSEACASVSSLIRLHHDQNFTPRAVARILQGIASPKYPLDVWGKDKRFWRRCLKVDFNQLVKIATKELIRYKC